LDECRDISVLLIWFQVNPYADSTIYSACGAKKNPAEAGFLDELVGSTNHGDLLTLTAFVSEQS
jgi:hypothetical protein